GGAPGGAGRRRVRPRRAEARLVPVRRGRRGADGRGRSRVMGASQSKRSVLGRVLAQARPYRWHIAGLLGLSLAAAPLALLAAVPLKIAVDSVVGTHPLPAPLAAVLPAGTAPDSALALGAVALLLFLIAVLTQVLNFAATLLRTYVGEKLVLGFRARLFRHSQRLSLAYHDARGAADSAYRIQWDAPCVQWVTVDGLIPLASAALTLALMFAVVLRLDWQLALVAAAACPPLVLIAWHYRRRLRARSHEVKERDSSVLSLLQEVLAALRVVKVFGQEDREHDRFVGRADAGLRARLRLTL